MRVVSLLPSATEILFALGFDREIVGVSHECDFPPRARTKTIVIHSRIDKDAGPLEIDRQVRDYVARGESLYAVDSEALQELAPDLIVTQDLCHVCAASPDDLATALAKFDARPEVLCLNPQDLGDVWRDILWVGEETGRGWQAEKLLEEIGEKLGALQEQIEAAPSAHKDAQRVAFLEWLQPIYVGGHWVPEMIELAGGHDVFGTKKTPSFRVTMEEVIDAAPDVVLVAPCGYTAEQATEEFRGMKLPDGWHDIPAVRNGQVYALEANSYFSRPGPRLVTGLEILAKVLHPQVKVSHEAESTIHPLIEKAQTARV
ncbi:MAG TPA: cobalamin-binding protein [Candidatus Dormibacteraeota bacterium]|jgi:iron complex transport system substrate-binding protein|nr:cobalamin-binding protein [Candidatus Dormibacteraeota bacterium]